MMTMSCAVFSNMSLVVAKNADAEVCVALSLGDSSDLGLATILTSFLTPATYLLLGCSITKGIGRK